MTAHAAPDAFTPRFSIVIPMYNRAQFIGRALASCLRQVGSTFEVVVVDDGSTDGSVDAVAAAADRVIRLFVQPRNLGQCSARNRGALEARGEWIVFLDSDDELAEGALAAIEAQIDAHSGEFDKILLMCRWSTGHTSPDPPLPNRLWDYTSYLAWLESVYGKRSECLPCVRRSAFLSVPYPEGHAAEGIHDLDFVKRFPVFGLATIGRVFHRDAGNNFDVMPTARLLKLAPFYAQNARDLVTRHGNALRAYAPKRWDDVLASGALNHFLAGNRRDGVAFSWRSIRRHPSRPFAWVVMLVGIAGPRPLARLRATRDRVVAHRHRGLLAEAAL